MAKKQLEFNCFDFARKIIRRDICLNRIINLYGKDALWRQGDQEKVGEDLSSATMTKERTTQLFVL